MDFAAINTNKLPGDVWMRVIGTRPRKDILFMAEHIILWIHGGFRNEGGFGYLERSVENDWPHVETVTALVGREQADLRLRIAAAFRPTGMRLRPAMTLRELSDEWEDKAPAPRAQGAQGAQGAHETGTTVEDFIDFAGYIPENMVIRSSDRSLGMSGRARRVRLSAAAASIGVFGENDIQEKRCGAINHAAR